MKRSLAAKAAAVALVVAPLAGCDVLSMESGQLACTTWTADKTAGGPARDEQATWARRYFKTFYDAAEQNPSLQGKGLNFQRDDGRLLQDVDAYCAAHPEGNNGQAAQAAAMQELGVQAAPAR